MQDRHSDTIIKEAIAALSEGRELLEQLSDAAYRRTLPPIFSFGIGSHFRHLLDFYTAFLQGLESGRVDYDLRERDEAVGKNRLVALVKTERLIDRLQAFSVINIDAPLWVRLEDPAGDEPTWSHSTFLREMQFLQSHTVHHYALIAVMLRLQDIKVNENFGVAPSTLKQCRAA